MALVILALLEQVKTRNQAEHRRKTKLRLMRLCVESGFKKEFILALLNFVHYTITLPKKEDAIYQEEVEQIIYPKMKPLHEQYPNDPYLLGMQRLFFEGKTIAERDKERDKQIILALHNMGLEAAKIALALNQDIKFVENVILEKLKSKADENYS